MTELTQAEIEQVNGGTVGLLNFFSDVIGLFNGLGTLLTRVGPLLDATKTFITALSNFFKP